MHVLQLMMAQSMWIETDFMNLGFIVELVVTFRQAGYASDG